MSGQNHSNVSENDNFQLDFLEALANHPKAEQKYSISNRTKANPYLVSSTYE